MEHDKINDLSLGKIQICQQYGDFYDISCKDGKHYAIKANTAYESLKKSNLDINNIVNIRYVNPQLPSLIKFSKSDQIIKIIDQETNNNNSKN